MLAQVFNHFLNLTEREAATVRGFSGVLAEGGEEFARAFYAYLNRHPATAALLERYQAVGGAIDDLVGKQLDHFERFLNAELGEAYATELIRVGEVHFEWRVEPPWIVGGYWLYSEHLTARARRDPRIPHDRRAPLIGAIERLILRDIGLMLEGYWQAALAEQEAHLERIEALQEHLSAILSNIPQLLWSVDPEQNELLYISPSHRVICEIDAELPIPCLNWTVPEDRERVVEAWRRAVGGMPVSLESRIHAPDGDARWFRRQFRPSLSEQGRVQRIDGIMEDISEEVKTRIELEALATTDALTGLYNRSVWYTRLEAMTSRAAGRIEHFPVMILDLNEFKRINDVLGHPVGDALLAKLGARLQSIVRTSDIVARLGGDEFGIVLESTDDPFAAAERVCEKIERTFEEPFVVDGHHLSMTAAVGVAICPDHGVDPHVLVKRADVALYAAKRRHKSPAFYEPALDNAGPDRLALETELRGAVGRSELMLYYQPIVDRHGVSVFTEALLRWSHPRRGILPPEEFLALAKADGTIRPMTEWVMREACRRLVRPPGSDAGRSIAVNLCPLVLEDKTFPDRLLCHVAEAGIEPGALILEVTEDALWSEFEVISEAVARLRAEGFRLAIDDFGRGCSSLARLQAVEVELIKIDKSLVLELERAQGSTRAIVKAIIELAHGLGARVVGEGVENAAVAEVLLELGCDYLQGFHFGPPAPAA